MQACDLQHGTLTKLFTIFLSSTLFLVWEQVTKKSTLLAYFCGQEKEIYVIRDPWCFFFPFMNRARDEPPLVQPVLGSWWLGRVRKREGERKKKGRLRRGMAWEPAGLSLTTLFWYSRSCYTLWLVDFDSTVNTLSVISFIVNQMASAVWLIFMHWVRSKKSTY